VDKEHLLQGDDISSLYSEWLCASCARANANFLMNRLAHHLHYPIRNISHTVCGRDVIRKFSQNFFVRVATGLKRAPGNEIIAVKNSCHGESPHEAKHGDMGREL